MSKKTETLQNLASDLLNRLGFSDVKLNCSEDQQGRIILQIDLSQLESGLLIGFHGETILALQLILSQILSNRLGEWIPVAVDIGDYRIKREETLRRLALSNAQRVKESHQPVTLPYLNSNERRIIHLTLTNDSQVETYSEGEGRQRRLIIKPKTD